MNELNNEEYLEFQITLTEEQRRQALERLTALGVRFKHELVQCSGVFSGLEMDCFSLPPSQWQQGSRIVSEIAMAEIEDEEGSCVVEQLSEEDEEFSEEEPVSNVDDAQLITTTSRRSSSVDRVDRWVFTGISAAILALISTAFYLLWLAGRPEH